MAFGYQVLGFGSGVAAGLPNVLEILVVAGGGSGANFWGGGGGAGGLVYKSGVTLTTATQYDAVVGAGGASVTTAFNNGNVGVDSTFGPNGGSVLFTAKGGGLGQGIYDASTWGGSGPGAGGCGGGSDYDDTADAAEGIQPDQSGDSGTYGFGNDGGLGSGPYGSPGHHATAGGGGTAAVGGTGSRDPGAGIGGAGKDYSAIFGTDPGASGLFGGGGGGHAWLGVPYIYSGGAGGAGGGGAGSPTSQGVPAAAGTAGTANTGGGGGGGGANPNSDPTRISGGGGSGVVVLRIPSAHYTGTVSGSPTVTTSAPYTIIEFTGNGSYTTS